MSGIVTAMDAGFACMGKQNEAALMSAANSKTGQRVSMLAAYLTCCAWVGLVFRHFTDGDFSIVLTMSAVVQCLGFFLLSIKVRYQKNAGGLSSKCLEMYIIFFVFRLSSTLIKNGYLPIDRSGDWVYQTADVVSAVIVLQLLYTMHKSLADTFTREHDTLDIFKAVPVCAFLAIFVKGDLNSSPFFDWVWTMSMLLDTVTLLPQLWMMTKQGGKIEVMTAHFVASQCVSRALAFSFWLYGYSEIMPAGHTVNIAGYSIMVAHSIQLLLCADFMYYYVKGMLNRMGERAVVLPNIEV